MIVKEEVKRKMKSRERSNDDSEGKMKGGAR